MGRIVRSEGRLVAGEVLSAREEAARRLDEIATLEEAARRRGFEAGQQEGREAALGQATAMLAAAQAKAEEMRLAARDVALALARKMAERIVGRAVELDPAVLGEIVGHALAASRASSGRLTVRLHPADLAAIETMRPAVAAQLAAAVDLRFVADESIGRAGCIVETPIGRLDARLDTQLDALERALTAR